ncbi:hypothetical protein [Mucilaginibacter gotjawali]|uniref:Signal transduction histidine kinase dimerisation/phosphoacceptor domain-containing protein n=1 Tax=Mucilaginibacter gotjawali TaxID=1550579 RepID=A0A839SJM7_9SPHI|nr:hypothetical protein [Mucilaginibacter gotjawali]MBB3057070.1 hypothetical protein [Mucilaginibacter gotjawali]
MKSPAKDKTKANSPGKTSDDTLRTLKHDINNQLSNILLALEQLRYEIPDASEDCTFYLESISLSTKKINALLKETE